MLASVRVLLSDILDYAGLFPPATLQLDEAIRNYARYLREPEAWMLARFICPASRLGELAPYVDELFSSGLSLRLSVLGCGGETGDQFLEGMRSDLEGLTRFRARQDDRTAIESFEVRLPGDLSEADDVFRLLDTVSELWGAHRVGRVPVFYEPWSETGRPSAWWAIMRGITQHHEALGGGGSGLTTSNRAGFKLRCGGWDASAYPAVEQLAAVISSAHAGRVPMKFTAGLHHPMRHHNEQAHADMHGFINVFAAGVLANSCDVNEQQVCEILATEDPESFEFTAEALCWRGVRITCDEIAKWRRQAVTSFGSCSFDEPRADLRNLGLL
ncbi:MAG: hypothetical protein V3W34_16955 [Phycisphaerae bacterium]